MSLTNSKSIFRLQAILSNGCKSAYGKKVRLDTKPQLAPLPYPIEATSFNANVSTLTNNFIDKQIYILPLIVDLTIYCRYYTLIRNNHKCINEAIKWKQRLHPVKY